MNDIKRAISDSLDWLEHNSRVPLDVADLAVFHGIKTADYFNRVINAWVNDLYNHSVSESEFVDRFADLINQQLTRAWNEGMRANGLDPISEMTAEYSAAMQNAIANEFMYVDKFAADIASGNFSLAQLQARANLWSNRYNDVKNQAIAETAGGKDRMEWVMGATEKHCDTCHRLNGIVAFAKEWEISGFKPQGSMLECGGWNCKCELRPTDKRRSPKALDALLTIGAA
jgi:hypothetical protein